MVYGAQCSAQPSLVSITWRWRCVAHGYQTANQFESSRSNFLYSGVWLAIYLWRKPSDTLGPAAVSLISGQTPVADQGARPTCLAMAATAAHEYGRGGLRLSVEHLWANTSARGGVLAGGARLSVLRTALVVDGQCEEGSWPYGPAEP